MNLEDRSRGRLPAIEPYEAEAFPAPGTMRGLGCLIAAGSAIGTLCLFYMLARIIF